MYRCADPNQYAAFMVIGVCDATDMIIGIRHATNGWCVADQAINDGEMSQASVNNDEAWVGCHHTVPPMTYCRN